MSGGGDEQVECPLCMEPLEIDDINFYPCTCGYQICRFCWHRIRTDENGLCPACRKQYPEDPAEFKPLTEDELQRIKKERRQKDLQRKQKAAENRKHLANVRVVQRNLVFVVGLSQRLAETEVLKKHEYFGKFGKIHKVVINQSTSYAGAQGPSASAYVTYNKSDDALKAILAVNNVHIDGRTLKASLGTTKYCSHFLRGTQCPKSDCMYLHELGEEAASFTKEEMQVGKHQEYEQRLLEQHMNSQNSANSQHTSNNKASRKKNSSPTNIVQPQSTPPPQQQQTPPPGPPVVPLPSQLGPGQQVPPPVVTQSSPPQLSPPNTSNKDAWPSLQPSGGIKQTDRLTNGTRSQHNSYNQTDKSKTDLLAEQSRAPGNQKVKTISETDTQARLADTTKGTQPQSTSLQNSEHSVPSAPGGSPRQPQTHPIMGPIGSKRKSLGLDNPDSLSLFSSTNGYHGARNPKPPVPVTDMTDIPTTEMSEVIPVTSYTDWQAAFGFGSKTQDNQDDDLGFDPLEESSRGLADLLEKENGQRHNVPHSQHTDPFEKYNGFPSHTRRTHLPQNLPPGFSLNHVQQQAPSQSPSLNPSTLYRQTDVLTSRMMGFMNTGIPPLPNTYGDLLSDLPSKDHLQQNTQNDCYNMKDWQDGLRALLPNINISFGGSQQQQQQQTQSKAPDTRTNNSQHNQQKNWCPNTTSLTSTNSWTSYDPAILTSGNLTDGTMLTGNAPHWLKSINQLTELDTSTTNHRLPFVQQFPMRNNVWQPQTHNPPPGFQTHIRPPLQTAEPHKLTEGLQ